MTGTGPGCGTGLRGVTWPTGSRIEASRPASPSCVSERYSLGGDDGLCREEGGPDGLARVPLPGLGAMPAVLPALLGLPVVGTAGRANRLDPGLPCSDGNVRASIAGHDAETKPAPHPGHWSLRPGGKCTRW